MPDNTNPLGGRLPRSIQVHSEGDQQRLYELMDSTLIRWAEACGSQAKTAPGKFIGVFNPLLYSTGITPSLLEWMRADSVHTSRNKRVHEVVTLSTGAVRQSSYELYAHTTIAREAGIPEIAIEALVAGRFSDDLNPEEQIAHRFAHQLAAEHRIDEALYREAESAFGRTGLVDMVFLIGMYLLTCAVRNAFEIPTPTPRTPAA